MRHAQMFIEIKHSVLCLFSSKLPQDAKLWLFNDQLCRSIWLEYVEDVKIKGIRTMRFTPPNAVFNFSNPDNYCYCPGVR